MVKVQDSSSALRYGFESYYSHQKWHQQQAPLNVLLVEKVWQTGKEQNKFCLLYSQYPAHSSFSLILHSFSICFIFILHQGSSLLCQVHHQYLLGSAMFVRRSSSFVTTRHDSRCILGRFLAFSLCIRVAFPLIFSDTVVLPSLNTWLA